MSKIFTFYSFCVVFLFAMLLRINLVHGQACADVDASSAVVAGATCPGNGSITLPALPAGTVYKLSGGGMLGDLEQSSRAFESLAAGTYTVSLLCSGEIVNSFSVTVPDKHSPLGLDITSAMVCEGTGTMTAVGSGGYDEGSSGSYQYAMWKESEGGANRPDAALSYLATGSWGNLTTGNYYVRVKDDCGNIFTQFVWVEASKPLAQLDLGNPTITCTGGGNVTYTYPSARLVSVLNGLQVYYLGTGTAYQYRIERVSSGGDCSEATILDTPVPMTDLIDPSTISIPNVVVGSTYRMVVWSPCEEEEVSTCITIWDPIGFEAKSSRVCAPTNEENIYLTINLYETAGASVAFPITLEISNSNGVIESVVADTWAEAYNLQFRISEINYPIQVKFTDDCGVTRTLDRSAPPMGASPSDVYFYPYYDCVTTNGAVQLSMWPEGNWYGLEYNSGNDADKTKYELINKATGDVVGTRYGVVYLVNNQIDFPNVPAGETYFLRVTPPVSVASSCGPQESNDLIVPIERGLNFTAEPTVERICNNGLNRISYNIDDNTGANVDVKLYKGTSSNGVLVSEDLNPGDLEAGTYYYVLSHPSLTKGNTCTSKILEGMITIENWEINPIITRSLSVNCQQVGSGPQNIGTAMLQFSGYGPFVVERSINGSTYTVVNASAASSYTEPSLAAGSVYNYRVTDQCGKSVSQQVMIKPLSPRITNNTMEPCENQPYILSGIDFGDPLTTYQWEKVGTAGILATTREYTIPNFTTDDNGSYKLTISLLNGCVVREVIVKLNSANCGQPFATGSLGDKVWFDTNSNGIQDSGETGVPGVPVRLQGYVGPAAATPEDLAIQNNWSELEQTVTDGSGNYLFDGLETGYYRVNFGTVPNFGYTSYMQGSDASLNSDAGVGGFSIPVFINADGTGIDKDNMTVDAGLVPAGSIGDYVWNDANGDGVQDADENPINGSTVKLYAKNVSGGWDLWGTAITDANGKYLFDGLPTGTYQVEFALPSGLVFTYANAASALDTEDSDADMTTGRSGEISINTALAETDNGRNNMTIDAGVTVTLPVKLASFEVKKGEGFSSTLKWTTTEEVNSSKFEIQRSPDAKTWKVIGYVGAQENSVGMVHYRYDDMHVPLGTNYYRLKMIDTDGSFAYSTIRKLSGESGSSSIVLYPNPVSNELSVMSEMGAAISKIELINGSGRVVVTKRESAKSTTIHVKNLSTGVYVVRIFFDNGSTEFRKVLIER